MWCAAVTLVAVGALIYTGASRASDDSPAAVNVRAQVPGHGDPAKPAGASAPPSEQRPLSEERQPPGPGRTPKGPPRSLFRCWQDGRIIFEGRGYGALPTSQVTAELKAGEGGSGRIQLLDMYGGTCVLELPK